METEIIKFEIPELKAVDPSRAKQIKETFEPMVKMLTEFEEAYNTVVLEAEKEITKEVTTKAKRLRIDVGKVRIETERVRKEQKEEYLRGGKAIDGVANILKWAVSDKENKLKEIEDYFEIQEQKRLEVLQLERVKKILPYLEDADERNLSGMDDDVWSAYLQAKKKEYEDRIAAEKKAEQDRIAKEKAEIAERKRIREENERLKKEAEEKERLAKIEAQKRAKEEEKRLAREEAERKARDEKERKEREGYEAKLKAEREEKERIQKELEAKAEAERKAKEEEEEKKQAELNKNDAEKVHDLISDLQILGTKYTFQSKKNQKMYSDVLVLVNKIIDFIDK